MGARRRVLKRVPEGYETLGELLRAVRTEAGETLEQYATRLGITRFMLCDVEHGRRTVSYARAAEWAQILGYEPAGFVEVLAQSELDAAGYSHLRVRVEAA